MGESGVSFSADNAWQRGIRDRILAPHLYGIRSVEGRYVFMDKGRLATILQRRYAVDTILQGRDGRAVCIEEKITRWPGFALLNFFLETMSCTVAGLESEGWMRYAEADYLLYAFMQADDVHLLCYLIEFPALKAWFWPRSERFRLYIMPNTTNHTAGRLVPIATVRQAVRTWRFTIPQPLTRSGAST